MSHVVVELSSEFSQYFESDPPFPHATTAKQRALGNDAIVGGIAIERFEYAHPAWKGIQRIQFNDGSIRLRHPRGNSRDEPCHRRWFIGSRVNIPWSGVLAEQIEFDTATTTWTLVIGTTSCNHIECSVNVIPCCAAVPLLSRSE